MPRGKRGAKTSYPLPLALHTGRRTLAVRTIHFGDHWALLVTPEPLDPRFGIVLSNPSTDRHASARVLRCATGEAPGEFEVAVELLEPSPEFWDGDGPG